MCWAVVTAAGLVACGGGAPPPKTQEMVPANSANEPDKNDATTTSGPASGPTSDASNDPSGAKPAGNGTTASGGMPQKIGGDAPAAPAPVGTATPAAGGPKVTKVECKKVLDKYVDLAIAADPNLAGLPPDVVKQAFAQAAAQSANPCEGDGVSRNQYKCAMKATSTDKWQACMK